MSREAQKELIRYLLGKQATNTWSGLKSRFKSGGKYVGRGAIGAWSGLKSGGKYVGRGGIGAWSGLKSGGKYVGRGAIGAWSGLKSGGKYVGGKATKGSKWVTNQYKTRRIGELSSEIALLNRQIEILNNLGNQTPNLHRRSINNLKAKRNVLATTLRSIR
jgi:hypothetical protein